MNFLYQNVDFGNIKYQFLIQNLEVEGRDSFLQLKKVGTKRQLQADFCERMYEAQGEMKIARRNINNLNADDTTLMAESEE